MSPSSTTTLTRSSKAMLRPERSLTSSGTVPEESRALMVVAVSLALTIRVRILLTSIFGAHGKDGADASLDRS